MRAFPICALIVLLMALAGGASCTSECDVDCGPTGGFTGGSGGSAGSGIAGSGGGAGHAGSGGMEMGGGGAGGTGGTGGTGATGGSGGSGGNGGSGGSGEPTPPVVAVTCPASPDATVSTTSGAAGFAYDPKTTTISVGGIVKFHPASAHDVNGDDPVLTVGLGGTACFRFDVAGTYGFHCTPHNFKGSIVVQP